MKVYRRIFLVRAKGIFKDLVTQQNAVLNLAKELMAELEIHLSFIEPLMNLTNKLITGQTQEPVVRKDILKDCMIKLMLFPQIQKMCKVMSEQDELHFDEMYLKGVFGIRAEVLTYEQSMQSILTQMNLVRAV